MHRQTAAHPLLSEIAEHPFFRDLPPEHISLLADCAMRSHFEKDEQIFRSGDPANRFYLLQKGKVALESATHGAVTTLQHIGAGDVLGWSWLFRPYTWHFDARAFEPTDAIFLYGTRVRELCDSNHDLGYELMNRTANVLIDRLMAVRGEMAGKK
jgi:CRP-like cAMP-binding protein